MRLEAHQLEGVLKALDRGEDFSTLAGKYSLDEATREQGGEVRDWIEEGLDPTGMGDPTRLWQALANHHEGKVTEPLQVAGEFYVFQILSRRPPRARSLEEARNQVEADLTRERVERSYQELIRQALQASEVKLFPEKIQDDPRQDDG